RRKAALSGNTNDMVAPPEQTFHSFSQAHAIALVWTLGILAGVVCIGLRLERERRWRWDVLLACLALLVDIGSISYFLMPGRRSWTESLPLQLCDLAGLLAPVALALGEKKQFRWARTLVYFWGLGLSSQAFVTPVLTEGFPAWRYWW